MFSDIASLDLVCVIYVEATKGSDAALARRVGAAISNVIITIVVHPFCSGSREHGEAPEDGLYLIKIFGPNDMIESMASSFGYIFFLVLQI